jgi:hypothetical protein
MTVPATLGDLGQNVAPDGAVGAAPVVDHDDVARRDIVDEIADIAARHSRRHVGEGDGVPGDPAAALERGEPLHGTRQPQPIAGIRDGDVARLRKRSSSAADNRSVIGPPFDAAFGQAPSGSGVPRLLSVSWSRQPLGSRKRALRRPVDGDNAGGS